MNTKSEVKLVNAEKLLEALFEPESRPCKRTLWNWVRQGYVPAVRVGKSVFFNLEKVRKRLGITEKVNS
jgi:hypothetical protein